MNKIKKFRKSGVRLYKAQEPSYAYLANPDTHGRCLKARLS